MGTQVNPRPNVYLGGTRIREGANNNVWVEHMAPSTGGFDELTTSPSKRTLIAPDEATTEIMSLEELRAAFQRNQKKKGAVARITLSHPCAKSA